MISPEMEKRLIGSRDNLIIPIEHVAVIYEHHTLDHALLVMTRQKYSVVPVIDREGKMKGLISLQKMMEAIMEIDDVNFSLLGDIKVAQAMTTDYPSVSLDFSLEKVLHQLVGSSFTSVVDTDGTLVGIIARSKILKGMISLAHDELVNQILEENK